MRDADGETSLHPCVINGMKTARHIRVLLRTL